MKKPFNPYPLNDGKKYKKFQFSPATLINLEVEMKTGTTHITSEPISKDSTAAELLIEAACRKCETDRGEYCHDATLLKKIKAMDKNEILLAIHGYFDGELIVPDTRKEKTQK